MAPFPTSPATSLAAWLDSYAGGARSAIQAAVSDGFRALHANTAAGDLAPRNLSLSGRRHLGRHLDALGLRIDALAAHFPGNGLADPKSAEARIAAFRDSLELCVHLRVSAATVSLGGFGDPQNSNLANEVLGVVADLADRAGVRVAVFGGREDPERLAEAIASLGCPQLAPAIDTAALDPHRENLSRIIRGAVAFHLRDVRRMGDIAEEVDLGRGDVDFVSLFGLISAADSPASLVVRCDRAGSVDAMRRGREYIEALLERRTGR